MNREPNKADVNCSTVLKMCTAELDRMKHWCAKNNNNCNDRFFMIAIKITPETSLLYAGSETARALRECGAGIESQCDSELIQLPANEHIPEAIRQ